MVTTEYQENISAIAISGTITRERPSATGLRASIASTRSSRAHCAAKQSSAIVATDRPTATLDSHESTTQMRCTSARGNTERKAQPNTNGADSNSCLRRVGSAGSRTARRSGITPARTQAQMLTTLMPIRANHHAWTLIDGATMTAARQASQLITAVRVNRDRIDT